MSHVAHETARRMKDAGFPQPESPTMWTLAGKVDLPQGEAFAPAATDILQYLPGWNLCYKNNRWVAWADVGTDREPEYVTFENENSAEAAAEAWFFEQSNAKK